MIVPGVVGKGDRLAREIVVDWVQACVTIDGHRFPYMLTPDVSICGGGDNEMPTVTLTVPADRITAITDDRPVEVYESPWADARLEVGIS